MEERYDKKIGGAVRVWNKAKVALKEDEVRRLEVKEKEELSNMGGESVTAALA